MKVLVIIIYIRLVKSGHKYSLCEKRFIAIAFVKVLSPTKSILL